MQTWHANLAVTTYAKGWEKNLNKSKHSFNHTEFMAEDTEEAKGKLLVWVKRKLARFKPGKKRSVFILASPKLKNGEFSANKMLRNRHSRHTIYSILRGGVNKVLVEGYGPEVAEERNRKV
jgi:hypothetical protein